MHMTDDQTILVKKSDGSFVRMPLADVQKMQQSSSAPAVAPASSPAPVAPVLPVSEPVVSVVQPESKNEEEIVSSGRVEHPGQEKLLKLEKSQPLQKFNPPKPVPLSPISFNDDAMFEEVLPENLSAGPRTSAAREKETDEVIRSLSFKASPGNVNRLRTIVQLFLKEVRSVDQTRDLLTRKEIDGGMALTPEQASEVLHAAGYRDPRVFDKIGPDKSKIDPPKFSKSENDRLEKELPTVVPLKSRVLTMPPLPAAQAPAKPIAPRPVQSSNVSTATRSSSSPFTPISSSTPSKPISLSSPFSPSANSKAILNDVVTKATFADAPVLPAFKLRPDIKQKTTMADVVTTTKPMEMTPVDEIRYFTLTDFRRLAPDPAEAAKRLAQKFYNLRDESILFYFEAIEAWKSAPLYADYLALVAESLGKRQPVSALTQDKKRLQIPELMALVELEKAVL
jgi:hypothetical protein